MTNYDFFQKVLKIFGIYWLIISISGYLPYYFESISYLELSNQEELISGLFYNAIGLIVNVVIALFFIFKPDFFINRLNLTEGFEANYIETPNFNKKIIKIVILVVAGIMLLNNLEYFYFELEKMKEFADANRSFSTYNKTNLIIIIAEVIICILVFRERDWLFSLLKLNDFGEEFVDSDDLLDT